MARTQDNRYEVVDGLQRLTSVFKFLDNRFALTDLGIRDSLNKKRFRDLDATDQKKLKNSALRSFELQSDTNTDVHFIVFERLNTGGTRLNEMEIRNCLYRGRLNELIKDLANDPDFTKCVNEKTLPKRMKDRTFVLRFLAFHERTHRKCKVGIKKFLNEFLDTYRNPPEEKLREYREVFKRCVKASLTVFGRDGFRLKKEDPKTSKSSGEWSTRSNIAIFQCVATSFANYRLGDITKNADRIYEEYLDLVSTDTKWVDYVRRATGETSRLEYVFEAWEKRLKAVLTDDEFHGTGRTFSKQLKRELFDQNRACSICGNEVKLLDDAVVDHVDAGVGESGGRDHASVCLWTDPDGKHVIRHHPDDVIVGRLWSRFVPAPRIRRVARHARHRRLPYDPELADAVPLTVRPLGRAQRLGQLVPESADLGGAGMLDPVAPAANADIDRSVDFVAGIRCLLRRDRRWHADDEKPEQRRRREPCEHRFTSHAESHR